MEAPKYGPLVGFMIQVVGFRAPLGGSGPQLVGLSAPSVRCRQEVVEFRSGLVDFCVPIAGFSDPSVCSRKLFQCDTCWFQ